MALDIPTLTTDFYTILKSGTAGSAVRSALGNGATSVIPADMLRRYNNSNPMPARVLAAFRGGIITGNGRDGNDMFMRWWLYDDEQYQYNRINTVLPLIIAAYPESVINHAYTKLIGISQEAPDTTYQLPCRSITFVLSNRQ